MSGDPSLVIVGSFLTRIDAEVARGALEAADIQSTISADDVGGMRPGFVMGVQLWVRSDDADRAAHVLSLAK